MDNPTLLRPLRASPSAEGSQWHELHVKPGTLEVLPTCDTQAPLVVSGLWYLLILAVLAFALSLQWLTLIGPLPEDCVTLDMRLARGLCYLGHEASPVGRQGFQVLLLGSFSLPLIRLKDPRHGQLWRKCHRGASVQRWG